MQPADALPIGRVLASKYEIRGVLGAGAFGITYRAHDRVFDRAVALKECFPASIVERGDDGLVRLRDAAEEKTFVHLRQLFYSEGQALAQFNHPNIVHVHQIFEENNTPYMALELVDGVDLETWLRANEKPTQHQLDAIFIPLLAALDAMHAKGYIHRDVSPSNFVVLRGELTPKLLDFGAARPVDSDSITAIVKRSYTAPEAYTLDNQRLQGPWSDIYSTAATIYRAVAGRAPPEAAGRLLGDELEALQTVAQGRGYRPNFLKAVDWGLAIRPDDRPKDIGQWSRLLLPTQEPISRQARRNRAARKIFLSYRRSDSEQISGRIFDRLSARFGESEVFFDANAIPAAVDFREHIAAAMRESAAVVAVIGPNWMRKRRRLSWLGLRRPQEDHVQTEIELAIANSVPMLPVLIGGAVMPDADSLPSSIIDLSRANATVVRAGRDFHRDIDQVIALIDELRSQS